MGVWTRVTSQALRVDDVLDRVGDRSDGAVLLFVGVVRDHADGHSVSGMTYEAYESMAEGVLRAIAHEAAALLGTERVAVVHRVGALAIGEASVAVAVSSPHRDEAYEASRYVIEQIKVRLPIWKREHYTDGEAAWVPGVDPREHVDGAPDAPSAGEAP